MGGQTHKRMKNFYLEMASHPVKFLSLLNYTRVKNFLYILFIASVEEKERIYSHYRQLVSGSQKQTDYQLIENYDLVPRIIPVFENIDVSIIVPVFNNWEFTDNCIRSIIQSVADVAYEIILADDCSSDETSNAGKLYSNLKIVRPKENLGFLQNCNNAVKEARGRYIVLLNNDTEVHHYWLEALFFKMEQNENIAICGSKLVYPDGNLQEAGGIIWSDGSGWNYGNMDSPDKPQYCYSKAVDYISGASIMVRKSFWDEVEGFDPQYTPAYYEDTDLAFEATSRGYQVIFHPHSVVTHFEGQTHGTDENSGIKSYQLTNREKFRTKWADKLARDHSPNGVDVFQARDRSADKRTILIIDHYVPWFDKDAGSRSTFMYIEAFIENGYNVKFIGDNFFAHQPYTDALEELGVEVLRGQYYAENWRSWVKENAQYIDVVYLHRPHIAPKYIDFIRENTNAKIVYQCHDLHHVRVDRDYQNTGDQQLAKEAESWRKSELALFNKSDVGLTFSTDEADILQRENVAADIYQVPLYLYDETSQPLAEFEERSGILFVGGFGHKPNTEGVLWFHEHVWPKVLATNPDTVLTLVGSSMPNSIKALATANIVIEGFVSENRLEELYCSSRVSILPLLHGAGVKGKLVESMRYQIPIVSTAVGLEGVSADLYQLYAKDEGSEFSDEVNKLLTDPVYWKLMRSRLKKAFAESYSKEKFTHFCAEIF
ncbi:MAG: GT2 family glycosyltransferase/glycosyltransferase involved in cell wall biosynthesis [Halieaceae bacterium]|jgi:GT2 family glycosyltransferase/glycosyltransferase involved in cell wall biosynthesis